MGFYWRRFVSFIWFYEISLWLGARITSIFMRVFYGIVVFYVGSTQYNITAIWERFVIRFYRPFMLILGKVYRTGFITLYQLSTINCFSGCNYFSQCAFWWICFRTISNSVIRLNMCAPSKKNMDPPNWQYAIGTSSSGRQFQGSTLNFEGPPQSLQWRTAWNLEETLLVKTWLTCHFFRKKG